MRGVSGHAEPGAPRSEGSANLPHISTSARLPRRPGRLSTLLRHGYVRRDAPGAALAAAAVLLLSLAEGGYSPSAWRAATAAFVSAAALALVARRRVELNAGQWVVAYALAALAGWTVLSALWSPAPGAATLEAQRTLLYVAAVVAAIVVAGSLLAGTLAGLALTCAYALGLRLLEGPQEDPFQRLLLHEPLGYANALGGLSAIGLAITAGLLVREPRHRPLGAVLVAVFGVTLVLTQSRGGWAAAAVGVAVAAALSLGRLRLARSITVAAGVLLAVLLALPAGRLADDLADLGEERAWYWHVAWREVADAPLAGRGAGTFELAWLERQPVPWNVLDAHSLYLETLAELGVVGLLLLALALAPPLVWALGRGAAPAAAGGYAAFLVHAGMDWDWEMPAVSVAGLLCGCAVLAAARRRGPPPSGGRTGVDPSPSGRPETSIS